MWSAVTSQENAAPCSRSKHSATLLGGFLYLLGGRNGNIPLKDFWRYNLAEGRWEQLKASGETPPCLQEHTAVAYKENLYVFGGELGFSAATETPLWVYHVKHNSWRKVRAQKGVVVPKGRRGHSALVYQGAMLVYGGYQDLRGSSADLWVFDFETESWHLLSGRGEQPPARHKHSAVLHDGAMWIYGGMTDLNDRADLWRWDTGSKVWSSIKSKQGPGQLHSHAACKLPSSMLLFGGERDGHASSELWRFHFGTETWERLQPSGARPHARAESVALAVSELLLAPPTVTSCSPASPYANTPAHARPRPRSIERANSTRPFHSKVSPCERKYVFGQEVTRGYCSGVEDNRQSTVFSKLSNMNLASKLSRNNCSYSVLSNDSGDTSSHSDQDTPSKMVKSASVNLISRRINAVKPINLEPSLPHEPVSVPNFQTALTPVEAARLVFLQDSSDEEEKKTDFSTLHQIFQPNNLTGIERGQGEGQEAPTASENTRTGNTGILARHGTNASTPGDVTRHSFHGNSEFPRYVNAATTPGSFHGNGSITPGDVTRHSFHGNSDVTRFGGATTPGSFHGNCATTPGSFHSNAATTPGDFTRHSFHGNGASTPGDITRHILYGGRQEMMPKSASVVRFKEHLVELEEETSDYASIETMNLRISPETKDSWQDKFNKPKVIEECNVWHENSKFPPPRPHLAKPKRITHKQEGPYGFSNPNYMGPDIHTILAGLHPGAKLLNSPPDSVLEDATGRFLSQDELEMSAMTPDTPQVFAPGRRRATVPRSLALTSPNTGESSRPRTGDESSVRMRNKSRASSASRVERKQQQREHYFYENELEVPLYMFLIGGKEHQVTLFKKPISIWRLELNPDIY